MKKELMEALINPVKTTSHRQRVLDRGRTIASFLECWEEDKITKDDWNSIAALCAGMEHDAIRAACLKGIDELHT